MTSPLFLSSVDLADLTDTPVKRLQVDWLEKNGWVYTLSRIGNPKVLRAYAAQRLGVSGSGGGVSEPDFSSWTK